MGPVAVMLNTDAVESRAVTLSFSQNSFVALRRRGLGHTLKKAANATWHLVKEIGRDLLAALEVATLVTFEIVRGAVNVVAHAAEQVYHFTINKAK